MDMAPLRGQLHSYRAGATPSKIKAYDRATDWNLPEISRALRQTLHRPEDRGRGKPRVGDAGPPPLRGPAPQQPGGGP